MYYIHCTYTQVNINQIIPTFIIKGILKWLEVKINQIYMNDYYLHDNTRLIAVN